MPGNSSKVAVGLVQRALLLLSYLLPAVKFPYQEHMPAKGEPYTVRSVRDDDVFTSMEDVGGTWNQPHVGAPAISALLSDGIQWYCLSRCAAGVAPAVCSFSRPIV